jgi:SAM-dependent methyltransferase
MGIPAPIAELIVAEHKFKPIRGDVLFIGRQTTYLNEGSLDYLLRKYEIAPPNSFHIEFDKETIGIEAIDVRVLSDRCFMRALGVNRLFFMDVSDYEGAEIVHDLTFPIPEALEGRFDFIYNGSCLDNIFNPAAALANLTRMLRPGGRLFSYEHGSAQNNPYTMFSVGWFSDYFVANRFHDYQAYVGAFGDHQALHLGPWSWFYFDRTHQSLGFKVANADIVIATIAEKGPQTTWDRQPIQSQYRSAASADAKAMLENVAAMSRERPIFLYGGQDLSNPSVNLGSTDADLLRAFYGAAQSQRRSKTA